MVLGEATLYCGQAIQMIMANTQLSTQQLPPLCVPHFDNQCNLSWPLTDLADKAKLGISLELPENQCWKLVHSPLIFVTPVPSGPLPIGQADGQTTVNTVTTEIDNQILEAKRVEVDRIMAIVTRVREAIAVLRAASDDIVISSSESTSQADSSQEEILPVHDETMAQELPLSVDNLPAIPVRVSDSPVTQYESPLKTQRTGDFDSEVRSATQTTALVFSHQGTAWPVQSAPTG